MRSTVQNSGVTLVLQALNVSSTKDKNPIYVNMSYYGIVEDIWGVDYANFRVDVIKCQRVNNNTNKREDENGFILVNLNKENHRDEPFILASQEN